VADEAMVPEASYVSFDTIVTLRSRQLLPQPDDAEPEMDELSQSLEAELLLPIPASIQPIPTHEPNIRIHFIRHAQVSLYNSSPNMQAHINKHL
jgi:broad specificity phosphatase PhoE